MSAHTGCAPSPAPPASATPRAQVIDWEMNGHAEGDKEAGGGMAGKMADVQRTIEKGGFWQQSSAIMLLRLTPVVGGPAWPEP